MKLMSDRNRKGSMMVYASKVPNKVRLLREFEKNCHKLHGEAVKVVRTEKTVVRRFFGIDNNETSGMRKELYASYRSIVTQSENLELSGFRAERPKKVSPSCNVGDYVMINGKRMKRVR